MADVTAGSWYTELYAGRLKKYFTVIHVGFDDIDVKSYEFDRKSGKVTIEEKYIAWTKSYFSQQVELEKLVPVTGDELEIFLKKIQ